MSAEVNCGSPAAIAAQALSVGYGREAIVSGLDFTLNRGEKLALVGSNGSGKSTLLKTVAGLIRPLAGDLSVLGSEPAAQPARVAYLGQFHPAGMSLPLRAIDIVRMARFARHGLFGRLDGEDERAVLEAIEAMGVGELADLPLNRLSGGQKQRVFIAQALARKADLLLFDEPASGLDAPSIETYRRLADEAAAAGAAVVIATHDIDEASACDKTMLLARRVVAYGPSEAVLTPEYLLSTFGIVGRYREGRIVAIGREHGCGDEEEHP
jgi:ABC-type Mn2+/Zn2+ transport system ATPase subunit